LDRQRIDKWLWHARVVRTRSSAAALVDEGLVRLNGARIDANSQPVRPGDVVTIAFDRVKILKVLGFSERRGDADSVTALCEDISPPPEPREPPPAAPEAGVSRPTKGDGTYKNRKLLLNLR
jgi:ribosome-associated heat shock protein Hsp15